MLKLTIRVPKVVYTVGTFDLLHVGHLALLEQCRELGDLVVVGVASDSVVNSYKPNVPVIPLDQREEMLRSLRCVDFVRPYHELEYVSGCKEVNVDIFVVGEDWGNKVHNTNVESYLARNKKEIVQVVYNPRTSSTTIKQNVIAQTREDTIQTPDLLPSAQISLPVSPATAVDATRTHGH